MLAFSTGKPGSGSPQVPRLLFAQHEFACGASVWPFTIEEPHLRPIASMELHLDPEGSWIIGKRNNAASLERFLKEMASSWGATRPATGLRKW